jgi:hypothetical protein
MKPVVLHDKPKRSRRDGPEELKDPWKKLREKPGVSITSTGST